MRSALVSLVGFTCAFSPVRNVSHMAPAILGGSPITLDNSWVAQLSPETQQNLEQSRKFESLPSTHDNRSKRPVYNGHYVLTPPTGLSNPRLVLWSKDIVELLQLSEEQVDSQDFTDWVSGNLILGDTWATPYALSIMGTRKFCLRLLV
jgi:hypothetical protein